MEKLVCPVHKLKLLAMPTKYGIRHSCPIGACTVVAWDGSTSTPADKGTRDARKEAHKQFDVLWKSNLYTRSEAYELLSNNLGIQLKDCHIGYFGIEQCNKVIEFSNQLRRLERLK